MNRKKLLLAVGVAVAVLTLTIAAFAANRVALLPVNGTLNLNGSTTSIDFDAFCNFSPCNITWTLVLSNSNVGSINNTSGPQTTFTIGSSPGTAFIFASDGNGHIAQAIVDVQ